MKHQVPLAEEKEFVSLDATIKLEQERLNQLKEKFNKYYKKGWTFKLLKPVPSEGRFSPPWKEILYELLERDYTPAFVKKFNKKLHKDYPKTDVATSFRPIKKEEE